MIPLAASANLLQDPALSATSTTNLPPQDPLVTPVLLATSVLSAIPTARSVISPAVAVMELQHRVSTVQITTSLQELYAWLVQPVNIVQAAITHVLIVTPPAVSVQLHQEHVQYVLLIISLTQDRLA